MSFAETHEKPDAAKAAAHLLELLKDPETAHLVQYYHRDEPVSDIKNQKLHDLLHDLVDGTLGNANRVMGRELDERLLAAYRLTRFNASEFKTEESFRPGQIAEINKEQLEAPSDGKVPYRPYVFAARRWKIVSDSDYAIVQEKAASAEQALQDLFKTRTTLKDHPVLREKTAAISF